jgi:hypothetical protein
MLKECQEDDKEGVQFANAINAKGENFTAESLFMVLILQQHLPETTIQAYWPDWLRNPDQQEGTIK